MEIILKDFFAKPSQKSYLIVFLTFALLSFIQLYLFKREIVETNTVSAIGLAFGIGIVWVIANLPGIIIMFFILALRSSRKVLDIEESITVILYGVIVSFIMVFLTYWSYEYSKSLNWFINTSIKAIAGLTILCIVLFIIAFIMRVRKEIKKNKYGSGVKFSKLFSQDINYNNVGAVKSEIEKSTIK